MLTFAVLAASVGGCGDVVGPTEADRVDLTVSHSIHATPLTNRPLGVGVEDLRRGQCLIDAVTRTGERVRLDRRLPRLGIPAREFRIFTLAIGDRATGNEVATVWCNIPAADQAVDLMVDTFAPEHLTGRAWPGFAEYRAAWGRSGRGSASSVTVLGEGYSAAGAPLMDVDDGASCDETEPPDYFTIWVCVDREEICDDEHDGADGWWEDIWSGECVCLESGWCHEGDDPGGSDPDDSAGSGGGGGTGNDGPPPDDECNPDLQECEDPCLIDPVAAECGPPEGISPDFYNAMTDTEKAYCWGHVVQCGHVAPVTLDAMLWSNNLPADQYGQWADGPADAARHCYWSALMYSQLPDEWASAWLRLHEAEEVPGSPSTVMDLANNEYGRALHLANLYASAAELRTLCLQAVNNGELEIVNLTDPNG